MAFPVMESIIGSMILLYVLETYLGIRQHAVLQQSTNPATLRGAMSPETYNKSKAYKIDKRRIGIQKRDEAALWWLLSKFMESEFGSTLRLFELPFSLYTTFVIEGRHGFNQTIGVFFVEFFVGIFVCGIIGAPIAAAAIVITQRGGPYLSLYLWLFCLVASAALMTVYPLLIAPLFNKFTPLPEGKFKKKIQKLAFSLDFPFDKVFISEASRRSTHSNAYMYGVFRKSIVLDDTLIKQSKEPDEVVAIIAHEMAHWKLNHTAHAFIGSQVLALLQFGLFDLVRKSSNLYLSFGFNKQPIVVGFFIFQHIVIPVQRIFSFGMNILSRSSEFKADRYAENLGYGKPLRASLVKLQEQNLSAVDADPWYSAYHHSHPSFAERLAALDEFNSKKD